MGHSHHRPHPLEHCERVVAQAEEEVHHAEHLSMFDWAQRVEEAAPHVALWEVEVACREE